jgi:hypothetical protein
VARAAKARGRSAEALVTLLGEDDEDAQRVLQREVRELAGLAGELMERRVGLGLERGELGSDHVARFAHRAQARH